MKYRKTVCSLLIGSLGLAPLTGCENLPGDEKTQGAVIGGVGGAVAGAVLGGKDNRLLGGLIGGALGAAGGYVIGAQMNKNDKDNGKDRRDEAITASERARENPARPEDVRDARTADLNGDGFVTLDEVVAMERAGLSSREMINRLEDTGQVFALSESQEEYLRERGVDTEVVRAMRTLNQERVGT